MWSMFYKGRFVMDLRLIEVNERLLKVHDHKYMSFDGLTEYYLFNDGSVL
jgi:hypothetical protein